MTQYNAALEAIDRILNRGGEADDVLRAVLAALQERGVEYAAIRFVESGELVDGPSIGDLTEGIVTPVVYEGEHVGELELAVEDTAFAQRVATLISAYVLVGWDTAGEPWSP
ncbi:MAG: hypothetical protein WAQ33_01190 [Gaiellaceae bacterium]